ncbi:hypothetical protein HK102_003052 [Quaeritorhiza haematococci]|nr:hypothetical protein HK102_003052 [Quaeritorhiza haematococci]
MTPIKITDVDVSKITLTAPGNLKYGRRSYINYDDNRQFCILLPELTTPFGAKRWHDEGKDPSTDQIQINVAFQGTDKRVVQRPARNG